MLDVLGIEDFVFDFVGFLFLLDEVFIIRKAGVEVNAKVCFMRERNGVESAIHPNNADEIVVHVPSPRLSSSLPCVSRKSS